MRTQTNYDEALSTRDTVSHPSEARPDRAGRLKDEGGGRNPAGQERLARSEGDRTNLHDQFVEKSGVIELPDQFTSPDQPDVPATCRFFHLRMNRANVALYNSDVRTFHAGEAAT